MMMPTTHEGAPYHALAQKYRNTYLASFLIYLLFQCIAIVSIVFFYDWGIVLFVIFQAISLVALIVAISARIKLRRLFFAQMMQSGHCGHPTVVYVQSPPSEYYPTQQGYASQPYPQSPYVTQPVQYSQPGYPYPNPYEAQQPPVYPNPTTLV